MLVFRIWSHLQLLKRGGATNRPDDLNSLLNGSIETPCPACPQPGKNTDDLPESEVYE